MGKPQLKSQLKSQCLLDELPRYWGALQEAWDGPALVAFCDGEYMGALRFMQIF